MEYEIEELNVGFVFSKTFSREVQMSNYNAKPFLKWAGGKTQLIPIIRDLLPNDLVENKIDTYIEPFVGGGALFFHLAQSCDFKNIYLIDSNIELVISYNVIKNNVNELIEELRIISDKYLGLNKEEQKKYYYEIREIYNSFDKDVDVAQYSADFIKRAAYTIFLNRTCFNGLYRVNKNKLFNVPMGSYKNPTILEENNLKNVSKVLQNAEILCGDFSMAEQFIKGKTFIYFDPPYRPISKTSAFNSYSSEQFNDEEQKRLKHILDCCNKDNVYLMESNSDPTNFVEDPFFDDLYSGYNIHRVLATRIINSNAEKRGNVRELVITNY